MSGRRKTAVFLTVLFAIVVLFSHIFTAAEADHDCSGEDCPVCQVVAAVENAFKGLSAAKVSDSSAFVLFFAAVVLVLFAADEVLRSTLITLKVKLSN